MHSSLTIERVLEGVERCEFGTENVGFCLKCGEETDGCEPDAHGYKCDYCGARAVAGAAEVLMRLA